MPTDSTNLIGAFIVGRLLAESVGATSSQATQWAAVLMATGLSPASILLVSEFARRDAANQPANQTAQLLELSRQTNQTVAQLQPVIQQAAAAAQAAAQETQQVAANVQQAKAAAEAASAAAQNTQQAVVALDTRLTELDRWARQEAIQTVQQAATNAERAQTAAEAALDAAQNTQQAVGEVRQAVADLDTRLAELDRWAREEAIQTVQQAATNAQQAKTAAEAASTNAQNAQKTVTEVQQVVAATGAHLDELERWAREAAAKMEQSLNEILEAVRKQQNTPQPQTSGRKRKDTKTE